MEAGERGRERASESERESVALSKKKKSTPAQHWELRSSLSSLMVSMGSTPAPGAGPPA